MFRVFNKISDYIFYLKRSYVMRKNWEAIAWRMNVIAPPSRPSLDDVGNYYKVLNQKKKLKTILVLGSTAELRTVAAQFADEVIYADISLGMKKAASALVEESVKKKEKFLALNWLTLDRYLEKNSCDAILGDLVIRQIPMRYMSSFFSVMRNLLAEDGLFITRTNLKNPQNIEKSSAKAISESLQSYFIERDPTAIPTALFRLYDASVDINFETSVPKVDEYFQKYLENIDDLNLKNQVRRVWWEVSGAMTSWTHLPEDMLAGIISKHFEIKGKVFASDYADAQFFPIYALCQK